MKIDLLLLQLAVIFLPGIIWARFDASYAAKEKPSDVEFFIRSFIFGIIVYTVEFLIFSTLDWHFTMADLTDAARREIVSKDIAYEIAGGIVISLILSLVWLYLCNYRILVWTLHKIRATKKFGDEDLWDYTFNLRDIAVEYVHVKDFANQYIYAGWVNTFSESGKLRELVLLNAIVYNFDSEELYRTPRVYLARLPENIHIEFPYVPPAPEGLQND